MKEPKGKQTDIRISEKSIQKIQNQICWGCKKFFAFILLIKKIAFSLYF